MKNKPFKKVLSVFLSVLMLMSAWVWVAPTDAAAAGSYYVRVYLRIYDGADSGAFEAYNVVTDANSSFYGKPDDYLWTTSFWQDSDGYNGDIDMAGFTLFYNNGTQYKTEDLSDELIAFQTNHGNNYYTDFDSNGRITVADLNAATKYEEHVYGYTLTSLPTEFFWLIDVDAVIGTNDASYAVTKLTVAADANSEEHTIWSGYNGSESRAYCYYGSITPTGIHTCYDEDTGDTQDTYYLKYTTSTSGAWSTTPVPTSIKFDSGDTINYTIPKLNADDSGSKYTRPAKVYDQYGVAMDITPTSYYITDANGNRVNSDAFYWENGVFYIKKETQLLNPGKTTPTTYYFVAQYGNITGRMQINLTNPIYTVRYTDPEGGYTDLYSEGVYGAVVSCPAANFSSWTEVNNDGTHTTYGWPSPTVTITGDMTVIPVPSKTNHSLTYTHTADEHTAACSVCNYTNTEAHNWVAGDTVPSSCIAQGYTNYSCVCGATKKDDYQPIAAHNYDTNNDGFVTKDDAKYTAPIKNVDGTWSKAVYTYTCKVCGATYTEEVERANYTGYDAVVKELEDLVNSNTITEEAKEKINKALENNDIADNYDADSQETVDNATDALKGVLAEIKADDFSKIATIDALKAAIADYNSLNGDSHVNAEDKAIMDTIKAYVDRFDEDDEPTFAQFPAETTNAHTQKVIEIIERISGCADGTHYNLDNAVLVSRPTQNEDGTWNNDGVYEVVCEYNSDHVLELKGVNRADYTEFDKALIKLESYTEREDLTDAMKEAIGEIIEQIKEGTYEIDLDGDGENDLRLDYVADYTYGNETIKGEQDKVALIVDAMDRAADELDKGIESGKFTKPDFTNAIAAWEEYLRLVEQYGGEVEYGTEGDSLTATVVKDGYIKDAVSKDVAAGFEALLEIMNDSTANAFENQEYINDKINELKSINAGIIDGTLRDPNFEAYDAVVEIYTEVTSAVITDEDKATVEAAMAIVDAIKANPDATAKDSDATIATQTAIIKAINDKYAVCVAGTHDYADATCTEAQTCKICGATDGVANGHEWGEPSALMLDDTTGHYGYYTYECNVCYETVNVYVDRADYTVYDALLKAYEDIVNDEKVWSSLTDETIDDLTAFKAKLDKIAQDYTKATTDTETGITTPDGQAALDALLEGLDLEIEAIQKSIEDGSGRMLDFSEFEEAVSEYEGDPEDGIDATEDIASAEDREKITELINETRELANIDPIPNADSEEQKKIDAATEEIRAIIDKYAYCLENGHTWGKWVENVVITDGAFETATYTRTCEKCDKVESYEVERENYDAYDDAVTEAEELLNNEDLTDAAIETIQNALDEAKKLDQNLPADIVITDDEGNEVVIDVNKNADTIKDTTDALNEVIDSLYDEKGELKDEYKKIDYTAYDNAVNAYENLKDTMTAEDQASVENIKTQINAIPEDGTAAEYQKQVDEAAEKIAEINAKYGDCATGNHKWGAWKLTTAPTKETEGEYTEICEICGATQITKVGLADYDEFNNVVAELENLAKTENLTDEAKQAIEDALADADALDKKLPADVEDEDGNVIIEGKQEEINKLVEELEKVVADTEADIADGSALEPDYEAWEEAEKAYDALDKTNVKAEIIKEAEDLKDKIAKLQENDDLTQATATQKDIDDATARLNEIIAGINDGSLRDPDYSDVEEKLEDANEAENLNKDTQDKIDAIEDALEEIKGKTDPEANAKDDQTVVDALEDQLDEILKDIEEGKATAPDFSAWDTAEKTYDALTEEQLENVKSEVIDEVNDLKDTINSIKNNDAANVVDDQPTINAATERLNEIIAGIKDGSLKDPDYSGVEEDLADAKEKAEDNDVNDEVKNQIEDIEKKLEDLKKDPETNAKDNQDDVNALEKELEDIIAGIEDGSLVNPGECTHEFISTVIAPTCNVVGYTIHVCKICRYAYKDSETPTIEHEWGRWYVTNGVSCRELSTRTRHCLNEGCKVSETEICRDENGNAIYGYHVLVVFEGTAATCTTDGYTGYTRCTVCGEVNDSKVIPATGHIDNNHNGNCDVCNYMVDSSIGKCSCLCHNDSFFGKLLFNIVNFFWKIFKLKPGCECGAVHW